MNQSIKKIGTIQPLDENGYVINNLSLDNIQSEYQPIIQDALDFYQSEFGDKIHSIYLRGSVAKGKAIPGISDLDTIAISTEKIPKEELYNREWFWKKMEEKYPFNKGVEIHLDAMDEVMSKPKLQFLYKTQCICIFGEDIRGTLPKFGLGKWAYAHSNQINDGVGIVKEWLKEENGEQEYKEICTWLMKRTVRIGFELVMEKEGCFTRDLYPCYEIFSKYYPKKSKDMLEALRLAVYPTTDMDEMWKVVHSLYDFLNEEASKRNNT